MMFRFDPTRSSGTLSRWASGCWESGGCWSSGFSFGASSSSFLAAASFALMMSLTGCAAGNRNHLHNFNNLASESVLASGSLSFTRTAPDRTNPVLESGVIQIAQRSISDVPRVVGLVPGAVPVILAPRRDLSRAEFEGAWLLIDTTQRSLVLKDSDTTVVSSPFLGASLPNLDPDSDSEPFSVILKQRNPLWFAPDEYFTARQLAVPSRSSRERFLAGALGEFVVYVAENFALYSGPVDVAEISGIRVAPNDMARVYYSLKTGTPVVLR